MSASLTTYTCSNCSKMFIWSPKIHRCGIPELLGPGFSNIKLTFCMLRCFNRHILDYHTSIDIA